MVDQSSALVVRVGDAGNARDVADLSTLRHRWRVIEVGDDGGDEATFRPMLAEWMDAHRSSHVAFIASIAGEAVAMAWLAVVDRVPGPAQLVRTCAYVQSAYVVTERRDGGVGTTLLTHVVDYGRAIGLDYIAVHPSPRSFPFYRRLGFAGTDRVLELDFRPPRGRA